MNFKMDIPEVESRAGTRN